MSVTVIGDVHGYWDRYYDLLGTIKGRSIQIGDMGVGFSRGERVPEQTNRGYRLPLHHTWFRGNHDNPNIARLSANYLGDWGYIPHDDIFWLGGAFSIDFWNRIQGQSWWADEELSYPVLQQAIDFYIKTKPRFVLSHEAPQQAAIWMLTVSVPNFRPEKLDCATSRTAGALQTMFEAHQPEQWIFGHYHLNKSFYLRSTKFTCVDELSTYELNTNAKSD